MNTLITVAGEGCGAESLSAYLDPLLSALVTCLEPHVPPQVQELALEGREEPPSLHTAPPGHVPVLER